MLKSAQNVFCYSCYVLPEAFGKFGDCLVKVRAVNDALCYLVCVNVLHFPRKKVLHSLRKFMHSLRYRGRRSFGLFRIVFRPSYSLFIRRDSFRQGFRFRLCSLGFGHFFSRLNCGLNHGRHNKAASRKRNHWLSCFRHGWHLRFFGRHSFCELVHYALKQSGLCNFISRLSRKRICLHQLGLYYRLQ